MNDAADLGVTDGVEGELPAEIFEDFEVSEGVIDLLRGEGDLGGSFVFDFVIEVTDTVHEGV